MNESMTKASAQIKTSEEEPKVKDESVLTLIPPCNREAGSREDVYDLGDIISLEEMEDMDGLAHQFLHLTFDVIKEWQTSKKYCIPLYLIFNKNEKTVGLIRAMPLILGSRTTFLQCGIN